ncbi:hypothetical protein SY88_17920 [Clostridiales bacterium PH28_bin88]|nr:hypothetical protein SY88_17920 [Clostridiales bacterium PH28_bin88]
MVDVRDHEKLAELAQQRNTIYGLLVLVYAKEPTLELLKKIKEPEFTQALAEFGVEVEEEFFYRSEHELLEDMVVEYTRLFIGPGKHISPHESVYVGPYGTCGSEGGKGLLYGEATVQVQRLMAEWGYGYSADFRGIPDHIGIELQLMFLLTAREQEAWRSGDTGAACGFLEKERRFLAEHLVRWVPTFCGLVEKEAKLAFYRGMVRITREFILSDHDDVVELLANCQR